ncbi:hypothetical protein BiPBO1_44 [Brucella phage BiPBO1]|uniref:DUF1382 family protein n=1 Tax=Brucella phage BiPBO1 TaxID=1718278 RepID=UPI0003090144|nr:DUF1382 family protein [Brucella inopinata]YP_009304072.1 DUF1382 family protein [Brucella phage BiPBO1]ALJ98258.1 hypothetical protein BiPBO1_44 [Brucella phage BiPBO1]
MTSKVAQIREAMSVAQDMTKAGILFVAVPVLDEADHTKLKLLQASRVVQIDREANHAE